MNKAIERLKKVFEYEQNQGYRNKAVIGGLGRLAERWQLDAQREATLPGQTALLSHIIDGLNRYSQLSVAERKEALDVMRRLAEQWDAPPAGLTMLTPPQPAAPAAAPRPQPAVAASPKPAAPQPKPVAAQPQPGVTQPKAAAPSSQPKPAPALPKPARQPAPSKPTHGKPAAAPRTPGGSLQPLGSAYAGTRPTPVGTASLNASVSRIPGIGTRYSERLAKLNLHTVGDMLWFVPRRYDDYRSMKPICQLRDGEQVTVLANVWEVRTKRLAGRGAAITTAVLADSTATIEVSWFNPHIAKRLHQGQAYVFSGKVQSYLGRLQMRSPEFQSPDDTLLHAGRLSPVYPLTEGISAHWMRETQKRVVNEWGHRVFDHLPEELRRRADLVSLPEALDQVHFPNSLESLAEARRRLAFDELFFIQLGVLQARVQFRALPAPRFAISEADQAAFLAALPFSFTAAQARATQAILDDLADERPMSRLLQGDVGSGKTAVAANAMWAVVSNRGQAAMMAPTEILAEQHYRSLSRLFAGLTVGDRPVRVALLTGNVRGADRAATLAGLASGAIDIAVGTQALIQEGVTFASLGLAVIDEQHRFGVRQRATLRGAAEPGEETADSAQPAATEVQAPAPHLLVMTATPIPRTLSLTIFGDLDASVIDEMPPGRQPIKTRWFTVRERERAYNLVRRQVDEGRQAFIIYPLVEESESLAAKAALPQFDLLSKEVFSTLRLGLLHGRMKSAEKEAVMLAMQRGEIDILVATSVVEVGIDIPNATIIMIEDAERFGLAQLHQFRGRVGRGPHASYCILVSDSATPNAEERLRALEQSQDGFVLAEKDLQLRGPGDFFGTRQSGLPDLKMAQLGDLRTLEQARSAAEQVLEQDPELSRPEHLALARKVRRFWRNEGDVS
ncbi:MAG: ATP-dependent DNA helicase RecG [Caldilineales bacterium]